MASPYASHDYFSCLQKVFDIVHKMMHHFFHNQEDLSGSHVRVVHSAIDLKSEHWALWCN